MQGCSVRFIIYGTIFGENYEEKISNIQYSNQVKANNPTT